MIVQHMSIDERDPRAWYTTDCDCGATTFGDLLENTAWMHNHACPIPVWQRPIPTPIGCSTYR